METTWGPVEAHFLKKELLRHEISAEFDRLSPQYNDTSGLRRFGPPFVPMDPVMIHKAGIDVVELHAIGESTVGMVRAQFPVLRYVLEEFVQTFPFIRIHLLKLGPTWAEQSPFWLKLQTLFESWKAKKISNSNDRGSTSKRELALSKVKALILMLFNAAVRLPEEEGYQGGAKGDAAAKKLQKLMSPEEQELLAEGVENDTYESELEEGLESALETKPVYVNGWCVNVLGASIETELKKGVIWGTRESHYYNFLVKVQREGGSEAWFVKRRYGEFKALAGALRGLYPNVKRPYLPSKDKYEGVEGGEEDGIDGAMEEEAIDDEEEEIISAPTTPSLKSPRMLSIGKLERSFKTLKIPTRRNSSGSQASSGSTDQTALPREHLRLALRGYLCGVVKREALANSPELEAFLCNNPVVLTPEERADVKARLRVDHQTLLQHVAFQRALVKAVGGLEQEVVQAKAELYEKGFHYVFDELREHESLDAVSGPLHAVVEVVEIEIASTLYEMLVGSDSSPEVFRMVKRMHRLMPYKMMATILRFTNPLQVVKKLVDLFTFQPFGGKSLLQVIFMGALSDDVRKYDVELEDLRRKFDAQGLECLYKRIDAYFEADDGTVERVKAMSKRGPLELCVATLVPDNGLTAPNVPTPLLVSIIGDSQQQIRREGSPYTLLVRYFQRKLRRWDKEMMRELWEASELMDVIKDLMGVFFEPLIHLFRRANVHKYVPIFQKFMSQVIVVCETHIQANSQGRGDIVGTLVGLLDRYAPYAYTFMRDIYLGDLASPPQLRLFEGMLQWMDRFLDFIRGKHPLALSDALAAMDPETASRLQLEIAQVVNRVNDRRIRYAGINSTEPQTLPLTTNWDRIHTRVVALGATVGLQTPQLEDSEADTLEELDPSTLAAPLEPVQILHNLAHCEAENSPHSALASLGTSDALAQALAHSLFGSAPLR